MTAALQGDNAVPFWVPARFLLTGATALALAWTALAVRPDLVLGHYGVPGALAVVHLLTLGCFTLVLVGAMHQLVPVLLVTRLAAPRLGGPTYLLLAAGALGVIFGLGLSRVALLAGGGSLVLAGLLLFGGNLVATVRGASRVDAVARAMLLAVAFLILTASLGLAIALTRVWPGFAALLGYVTPLHLGLGLAGAFFVAIAGAGHKLLAMFVLAHGVGPARLNGLVGCVTAALALLAIHAFAGPRLALGVLPTVAVALLAAAVVLLAWDVRAIVRARMRRNVEPAMATYLAAFVFLLPIPLLLLAGAVPAAVMVALLGFVPLAVSGMLVKITTFLAWQHRYASQIGKRGGPGGVPMLADMTRQPLARTTMAGFVTGGALIVIARWTGSPLLVAAAGTVGALGAWALLAHLAWIVWGRHVARPLPAAKGAKA